MMGNLFKTCSELWERQSGREKTLICIAMAILSLLLIWQFVFKPASEFPIAQSRAYKQAELDLKIMQKGQAVLQNQIAGISAKPTTILTPDSFQSAITNSAKDHGVSISRRQPNDDAQIMVWLESTQSKPFYAWVDDLTSLYNITVSRAQINDNGDGSLRAQLTFKLEK